MKSSKHGQIQEREINLYIVSMAENGCFFPLKFSQLPSQKNRIFHQGENKDGTYLADGALVMFPSTSEDLSTWMRRAHACRATSATEVGSANEKHRHHMSSLFRTIFWSIPISDSIWFYPFEQMLFLYDFPMKIDGVLRCHFPRSVRQANDVSSRSHAVCMLRLQSGGSWLPWLPFRFKNHRDHSQNRSKSQWHCCFTPARSAAIDRLRRNGEAEGCHVPFQGTTAGGSWNQRFPARAEGPYLSDFFGMFFKYESCALHHVALLCAFFSGRT